MSRCYACDKKLSEFELTRKIVRPNGSISYPDLCNKCFNESNLAQEADIVERIDLKNSNDDYEEKPEGQDDSVED